MRSQDEIVARIEGRKDGDPLGFEVTEYMMALDFNHAKPYLEDGVTEWKARTQEETLQKAEDYMPFAIKKAEGERGISANRSIMHYIAWLWLLEEDDLLGEVEREYEDNYHDYGMDILRLIADHFGWQT